LRPLKTLRDKTNDQTSEKPKSKPVMQTSLGTLFLSPNRTYFLILTVNPFPFQGVNENKRQHFCLFFLRGFR